MTQSVLQIILLQADNTNSIPYSVLLCHHFRKKQYELMHQSSISELQDGYTPRSNPRRYVPHSGPWTAAELVASWLSGTCPRHPRNAFAPARYSEQWRRQFVPHPHCNSITDWYSHVKRKTRRTSFTDFQLLWWLFPLDGLCFSYSHFDITP